MTDDYTNHYALLIGTCSDENGRYTEKFQATTNDAEWLATILKACKFPDKNVKVLTGFEATRVNIIQELDNIAQSIDSSDEPSTVVVFFSGHCRFKDDKAIMIPNINSDRIDLTNNGIDGRFLVDKINLLYANRVLIVLNTCYADAVIPKFNRTPLDDDRLLKKFRNNGGTTVFSAAQASGKAQTAHSAKGTSKRYSPFTIAFGRALTGIGKTKPKDTDLILTSEVIEQAAAFVRKLTKDKQQPAFDYQGGNFPVGRYWDPRGKKELFLGDEDDIAVDIEELKEPEESLATPSNGQVISVTYNGPVNAKHSVLGNSNHYGSGTMSFNFTENN
ncbi:hypothetical protein BC937DRAFT_89823 [Endogone sp. FLAS-F59071]|nr:hypothetical protein BC937DRAFT_89823 [Endogone sp. FLAS-F59071]|eukprot:RUS17547.1 hypothetical protein BC937DRAFT_89823 [Endogone sp. FLAS-F59071]